jgi:hypothetical protein
MLGLDASEARAAAVRRPARCVAPAAVLAAGAGWTLGVRGVDHRFISFSDGVYTYVASALAAHGGHELYGTIVLSQPPAVVLGAAALWRLSPHVETIRFALALLGMLTALLAYALARRAGLQPGPAAAAALLALTAPIHAQFSGLDGEALLAPLALTLALVLERPRDGVRRHGVGHPRPKRARRVSDTAPADTAPATWPPMVRGPALAGVLVGAGFFVKLTWLPIGVAALAVTARTEGRRALLAATAAAAGAATALYAACFLAFGWRPGDLLAETVLAQSGSGLQLAALGGLAAIVVLTWGPLLPLAAAGTGTLTRPSRALLVGALAAGIFTLKQGTFFNVLDPAEPFLAVAAVSGALSLWRGRSAPARWLAALCALGLALHVASLTGARAARVLPAPLGAAVVSIDDEADVDRAARAIDSGSSPASEVLVNPLLAVVAGRKEVAGQADWFILAALQRSCGADRSAPSRCRLWSEMKRAHPAVVSVDRNVRAFDPAFAEETGTREMRRLLRIDRPPLDLTLYASQTPLKGDVGGPRPADDGDMAVSRRALVGHAGQ